MQSPACHSPGAPGIPLGIMAEAQPGTLSAVQALNTSHRFFAHIVI